jgi:uncharacterized protein YkwD
MMPPSRITAALALGVSLLLPPDALALPQQELLDLVNELRLDACPGRAQTPLRADPALDAVAGVYADGGSLQRALDASGYASEQAAAIRLDAVRLDAGRIASMLRERFCSRLADPDMDSVATLQRGETLWVVVAERRANAAEARARSAPDRAAGGGMAAPALGMLELVNEARAQGRRCGAARFAAAPPLRYSPTLEIASVEHARDMASRGYFDHDTPEGVTPTQRLARTGYAWSLTGENLAKGRMEPEEALRGWLESPGHCANIMDARFTEMGFGLAADDDREGDLFWVQTFAAPRGEPSPR